MSTGALDPLIHDPERLRVVATLAALPDGDALSTLRLQDMLGLLTAFPEGSGPDRGTSPAQLQAKEHGRTVEAGPRRVIMSQDGLDPGCPRPRPDAPDNDAGGPRAQVSSRAW